MIILLYYILLLFKSAPDVCFVYGHPYSIFHPEAGVMAAGVLASVTIADGTSRITVEKHPLGKLIVSRIEIKAEFDSKAIEADMGTWRGTFAHGQGVPLRIISSTPTSSGSTLITFETENFQSHFTVIYDGPLKFSFYLQYLGNVWWKGKEEKEPRDPRLGWGWQTAKPTTIMICYDLVQILE
jgi:hypothetical protein